ncbi:MAG TPA: triphosphoribosyl-dephospho-CoA synthase [Gemmata sp.]|nr:triphosphoribosyl-dephospho-CoA synthase [Gemmata sp.]
MTIRFTMSELVQTACIWEVTARKVGNVHRYADFKQTSYLDFVLSAGMIASHFDDRDPYQVGLTINLAVRATTEAIGQNTNLGIILLLAPLCAMEKTSLLRPGVERVLTNLTQSDAKLVFEAIRLAKPGGLGDAAEQDVRHEPTITLLEAMKLATDRDMIARQYANGFADVFDFGLPTFLDGFEQFGCIEAAIIDLQFRWLAKYPDSLIARKNGQVVADDVRERASEVMKLGGLITPDGRRAGTQLDQYLRSDGNKLNPGTTADLIAACLFVALRENKVVPSTRFPWEVEDWL